MGLLEEAGTEVLPNMDACANQHVVGALRVEDVVRLKAKPAIAGNKLIGRPKVRSKPAW
jgi:hypothetical protein